MVKRLKSLFSREIKGLHEAAYLLAFFSIISQLFALFRDRLLAGQFGTGLELDIYYAAFKLPDLLFVLVSTLVSVSVLVPQFVKYLEKKEDLKKMVDSVFTVLSFISVIVLFLAFVFAPKFLTWIVPDLLDSRLGNELIVITRILLIQPIILSVSSFMGSIVQAYKKFTIYAISPVLYNFGIILGISFLYPKYGLVGLSYGVVLGAFLHLLIQVPFIFEEDIYPKLTFKIQFKKIWYVILNSLPRTASMFANQGILIFMTFLASSMVYGSLSTFNLSYNLQSVPLAIIGVSYSLAAFPSLSKYFHSGQMDKFYINVQKALRHIIFWSFPIMAMFVVLRAQIVRVILGSGNFDWESTRLVAASLAIFTLSILAQSVALLFLRAYYAMGRTLKPFVITVAMFISVLASSYFFMDIINSEIAVTIKSVLRLSSVADISVLALAMAYSFGQIIYVILLVSLFKGLNKIIDTELVTTTLQSVLGSMVAFVTSFLMLNILDDVFDLDTFWGIFSQGFIAGIAGLTFASIFFFFIGNREFETVVETLKTKFWKTKPLSPEVEEEL
jgi:putative peptidoglycan lipid II flippase